MKSFLIILTVLFIPLTINGAAWMEPAVKGSALDFIERIVGYILYLTAFFLAPLFYLLAALIFFTAAGSAEKIDQAKKLIFWTSVGLVVILLARGFLSYLNSIL